MSESSRSNVRKSAPRSLAASEREEYSRLVLLERLESILEELEELGLTTRAEIEARVLQLHAELDSRA